jgi:2-dehydro-3-deoxyphosphogluconate aldolase/(4S)-4-hydroxy-2-oxoglutarate aldolase
MGMSDRVPAMRTKAEIISLLTNPGIIAVVRAQKTEQVIPLSEALIAGGVIAIEITMTTPNAIEAIRDAREKMGERALIGVGTVLEAKVCREAIEAGAEFVVTPICRTEFVRIAYAAERPIAGAYTTEALAAHEAGADFTEIFRQINPASISRQWRTVAVLANQNDGRDVHNVADFEGGLCGAGCWGFTGNGKDAGKGQVGLMRIVREFVEAARRACNESG